MIRSLFWSRFTVVLTLLATLLFGLSGTTSAQDGPKPIRALLVIGGCCHDYAVQKDLITKGISKRANVQWVIAYDPDKGTKHLNPVYGTADWAKNFDVIVHDECCADVNDMELVNRILEPHRQGLPGVVLHCAMHSYRTPGWNAKKSTPWFEFTGLQTTGHGAQIPIGLTFLDKDSPITLGQKDWTTINEELYNNITGKLLETAQPLIRGKQGAKNETIVAWTNTYMGKARSSAPPWVTTTKPSMTRATSIWLRAACFGPWASSTRLICNRLRRCCWTRRNKFEIRCLRLSEGK